MFLSYRSDDDDTFTSSADPPNEAVLTDQLDETPASFIRSRSFCQTDFYKQFHAFIQSPAFKVRLIRVEIQD